MEINCPTIVRDYNQHMGYVDKSDMLKSTYQIDRKSKKFWHRIFWHFLDVAVTNDFIIYRTVNKAATLKKIRIDLSKQLIGSEHCIKLATKKNANHLPVYRDNKRRCVLCRTKEESCKTRWYCDFCNLPFCLTATRNCFTEFHKKTHSTENIST